MNVYVYCVYVYVYCVCQKKSRVSFKISYLVVRDGGEDHWNGVGVSSAPFSFVVVIIIVVVVVIIVISIIIIVISIIYFIIITTQFDQFTGDEYNNI